MEGFAPEFQSPEQFIIDITYEIWEKRGVGRINEWYAAHGPVRTPHGVTETVKDVVQSTLSTMHEFPDRELLAGDIIIGHKTRGFLSSHRVRSPATHLADGAFGTATNRPVTILAIADCLCQDNQVVDEWLLRDQAALVRQLGRDPALFGEALGQKMPQNYAVGNDILRDRWADPDGFTVVGNQDVANDIIDACDAIWNRKNFEVLNRSHDRALRFEGPGGALCYGRKRTGDLLLSMMAAIPDGLFEPHHIIVRQDSARPVRVALRWSYCGTHNGRGRYGAASGVPLAYLGISHFELRDGKILNEWMVIDETAVYAQLAAYLSI